MLSGVWAFREADKDFRQIADRAGAVFGRANALKCLGGLRTLFPFHLQTPEQTDSTPPEILHPGTAEGGIR